MCILLASLFLPSITDTGASVHGPPGPTGIGEADGIGLPGPSGTPQIPESTGTKGESHHCVRVLGHIYSAVSFVSSNCNGGYMTLIATCLSGMFLSHHTYTQTCPI